MKVFVETEKGSTIRTRYNESTYEPNESFKIRFKYPFDYGFIIGTNKKQKDCIDCYILTGNQLKAGAVVDCEPVGMIEMIEDDEIDHKVLFSLNNEKIDLEKTYREIKEFIENVFSDIPDKQIKIGGLLSKQEAINFINSNL